MEESKEVEICVGLVDAAHVKAARNNFKRLAAAGEDDCRRRTLASPPHFVAERGSGMSSKAAKAQQQLNSGPLRTDNHSDSVPSSFLRHKTKSK